MAKIVPEEIINRCWDCPNFCSSIHGSGVCNHRLHTPQTIFINVLASYPTWCPLDNAPEPKDYGEEDNMSYAEFIKRKGGKK